MGPPRLGLEKNFQNGGSQMAGKRYFCVKVFTVFKKRALFPIFYAEYTKSVFDILSYPESTKGSP